MSTVSYRRGIALAIASAALVVACANDATDTTARNGAPTETIDPATVEIAQAIDDSSFPDVQPDVATGIVGFSRYVWSETASGVVPLLVEGPLGNQVRCQDSELPCSYQDLKELATSGDPIPSELKISREELTELVDQLDTVNATIHQYKTMDEACAAGYSPESVQNANMGIHMSNTSLIADGFDPSAPEMLLWAKPGGEKIPRPELGDCDEAGRWTGDEGYEVVGAAFLLPMTPDHPETFAGPFDNWHIHYSACSGAKDDNIQGDQAACEKSGGIFFERTPVWMIHAYVADGFENEHGAFSMYNDSIWPLGVDVTLSGQRSELDDVDGSFAAPIVNFDFGDVEIDEGEAVTFTNSDSLPHTVTAGTPGDDSGEFDSGVLGTGSGFTQTFDEAGNYAIYCSLHPQMTAKVVVRK